MININVCWNIFFTQQADFWLLHLKKFFQANNAITYSKFSLSTYFQILSNCEFLQKKETYLVHLILIKPQNLDHYARTTCPPAWNLKNDGNHNTCKMVKRSSFKKSESFFFLQRRCFISGKCSIANYYYVGLWYIICRLITLQLNAIHQRKKNHFLKCWKNYKITWVENW